MIITPDNHKRYKDSYSFSNMIDDDKWSLLKRPSQSLDLPVLCSSYVSPPLGAFENPFDDPNMEPMPLGSNTSSGRNVYTSPFSVQQLNKPMYTNLRRDLISLLGPAIDLAESKGSSNGLSSTQGPCKRQRTKQIHGPPVEESMARFRPYQETQWREKFKKLVQYKLKNGHCCVPHSYREDPVLARWVKRQRYQFKKLHDHNPTSTMTTRRIQELESIGFVWHSHASAWEEKLNELKAFKQSAGHCNVPSHYKQNSSLSTWVKCQRRQYKLFVSGASSSTMTMERLQELESLGFLFDCSTRNKAIAATV